MNRFEDIVDKNLEVYDDWIERKLKNHMEEHQQDDDHHHDDGPKNAKEVMAAVAGANEFRKTKLKRRLM